MKQVFVLIK